VPSGRGFLLTRGSKGTGNRAEFRREDPKRDAEKEVGLGPFERESGESVSVYSTLTILRQARTSLE